jgi:hypothetical protein
MPSTRWELAEDVCPVSDELLGELYRANDLSVPYSVSILAPDIRALLALFCYRRSHLHSMGLALAATCDEHSLVRAGQGVGEFLFASSREISSQLVSKTKRRKITLATGVIGMLPSGTNRSGSHCGGASAGPPVPVSSDHEALAPLP